MKRPIYAIAAMSITLLGTSPALASGFFLYELSPRGVAQAGATVAEAREPATLAFNTAGMTHVEGLQIQANLYTYFTSNDWESPDGSKSADAEMGVFPIPSVFVTYRPNKWMTAGVGGYSMWGLAVDWPEQWEGYAVTKKSSLRSYQVQPSLAFGPFSGFSMGVGTSMIFGSVELSRGLALGDEWGKSRLGGTALGLSPNVGVHYEPNDWLRFGAQYRHGTKMKLAPGDVDFDVPVAFDRQLPDQEVRASLSIPGFFQAGARVAPTKDFEVELAAFYILWHTYDKLTFQFEDPALNQELKTEYHDTWEVRLGGQYTLGKLALRGGFLFDETPIPDHTLDPTLPDAHRWILSTGVGYDFGMVEAALAYQYLLPMTRTVTADKNSFPGTYHANIHSVVLGATLKL